MARASRMAGAAASSWRQEFMAVAAAGTAAAGTGAAGTGAAPTGTAAAPTSTAGADTTEAADTTEVAVTGGDRPPLNSSKRVT
jgi:hypothetical protein